MLTIRMSIRMSMVMLMVISILRKGEGGLDGDVAVLRRGAGLGLDVPETTTLEDRIAADGAKMRGPRRWRLVSARRRGEGTRGCGGGGRRGLWCRGGLEVNCIVGRRVCLVRCSSEA